MTAVVGGSSNGVETVRGDGSLVLGDAVDSVEPEPSRRAVISTVTVRFQPRRRHWEEPMVRLWSASG